MSEDSNFGGYYAHGSQIGPGEEKQSDSVIFGRYGYRGEETDRRANSRNSNSLLRPAAAAPRVLTVVRAERVQDASTSLAATPKCQPVAAPNPVTKSTIQDTTTNVPSQNPDEDQEEQYSFIDERIPELSLTHIGPQFTIFPIAGEEQELSMLSTVSDCNSSVQQPVSRSNKPALTRLQENDEANESIETGFNQQDLSASLSKIESVFGSAYVGSILSGVSSTERSLPTTIETQLPGKRSPRKTRRNSPILCYVAFTTCFVLSVVVVVTASILFWGDGGTDGGSIMSSTVLSPRPTASPVQFGAGSSSPTSSPTNFPIRAPTTVVFSINDNDMDQIGDGPNPIEVLAQTPSASPSQTPTSNRCNICGCSNCPSGARSTEQEHATINLRSDMRQQMLRNHFRAWVRQVLPDISDHTIPCSAVSEAWSIDSSKLCSIFEYYPRFQDTLLKKCGCPAL